MPFGNAPTPDERSSEATLEKFGISTNSASSPSLIPGVVSGFVAPETASLASTTILTPGPGVCPARRRTIAVVRVANATILVRKGRDPWEWDSALSEMGTRRTRAEAAARLSRRDRNALSIGRRAPAIAGMYRPPSALVDAMHRPKRPPRAGRVKLRGGRLRLAAAGTQPRQHRRSSSRRSIAFSRSRRQPARRSAHVYRKSAP